MHRSWRGTSLSTGSPGCLCSGSIRQRCCRAACEEPVVGALHLAGGSHYFIAWHPAFDRAAGPSDGFQAGDSGGHTIGHCPLVCPLTAVVSACVRISWATQAALTYPRNTLWCLVCAATCASRRPAISLPCRVYTCPGTPCAQFASGSARLRLRAVYCAQCGDGGPGAGRGVLTYLCPKLLS